MKRDKLMQNPEREFRDPQRLMEDQELSDAQKIKLLMNWRLDVLELQRATEENMAGKTDAGEVGEKLANLTKALESLGANPRDGTPI